MEKVLIVEDEKPILELIKMNLTMVGYETLEAMDGEKALNIIKKENIDLIILDIMLPKIDGYELLNVFLEHKGIALTREKSKFLNAYKSASSRLIKKDFPLIKNQLWKEYFWSRSFCLITTGGAPRDIVREYIENQGMK